MIHNYKACWPTLGPYRSLGGAPKGPFGLKQALTGRKALEARLGARFGSNCCKLVRLGWSHSCHTLLWGSGMDSEGPRGPDLVPTAADWSAWAAIIVYHTLWPGIGPLLGPLGPQKGSFWPKMRLGEVLEGLRGPPGARFGPNCHRLLCLSWAHGRGPLSGSQGPQKRLF